MSVSVVVPFRPDQGERSRAWAWLRSRYEQLHPDWEIVVCDAASSSWWKAAAVNQGVAQAAHDTLVVADADCVPDVEALREAAFRVGEHPEMWAVPFGDVYRLAPGLTGRVLESPSDVADVPREVRRPDLDPARPRYRGKPGGGIVVISRATFSTVGGMDERFVRWGGEDLSFACALTACAGPPERFEEPLWHLWHEPQPDYDVSGRIQGPGHELLARYRAATRHPVTMRALIAERTGVEPVGCGCGGSAPANVGAPAHEAQCLTCGLAFTNYEEADAHRRASSHAMKNLRALGRARGVSSDPFVATP